MINRRFVLTLLVLGALLAAVLPSAAQAEEALRVRLVHGIPGGPAADFLIDGTLAAVGLEYAEFTPYLTLTGGEHTLTVQAGGNDLASSSINAVPGQALTVVVGGTPQSPEVQSFEDDLSPVQLGNVRLSGASMIGDVEAVDMILLDGGPIFTGLAYAQNSGGVDIPANVYPLAVVPSGGTQDEALSPAEDYALRAGMHYRLLALGGDPAVVLLEAPVRPAADGDAWVRVAHGATEGAAVDVYAGDTLLIPALEIGAVTQHAALPVGSYTLSLRETGAEAAAEPLATLDLALDGAGQAITVVAVNNAGAFGLVQFEDDTAELALDSARIAVLNAIPGANVSAALGSGVELVDLGAALAPDASSPSVEVTPGEYDFTLSVDDSGGMANQTETLNGGILYSLIAAGTPDQPQILLGELPLNFQPGSAAVAGEAAPEAFEPEVTEEAVQAETTPEPQVAAATAEPEVVAAEPTQAVSTPVPQPTAAATGGTGLIGRVYNLNPGSNIHIRQYPNAEALSLGLAPMGSVLTVLGRAGEPDFVADINLPPDEDADPQEVWLRVVYNGADGSVVTGWAVAQFVEVREDGERVRLADIEPLRSDVPGEVSAGGAPVAAPTTAAQADFYGVVIGLDPGVSLHVRRTPTTEGESLARMPVGTAFEVLGIMEDNTWLLVRYNPPEGGSVIGWSSTTFVEFVYRGERFIMTPENVEELMLRGALVVADPTVIGEIGVSSGTNPAPAPAQTQPQAQPTALTQEFRDMYIATVVLNQGANLHMRRSPDSGAESLARIPGGATVVVLGRTSSGDWLLIDYQELNGWISSLYVEIRFNGRLVELTEVPIVVE